MKEGIFFGSCDIAVTQFSVTQFAVAQFSVAQFSVAQFAVADIHAMTRLCLARLTACGAFSAALNSELRSHRGISHETTN